MQWLLMLVLLAGVLVQRAEAQQSFFAYFTNFFRRPFNYRPASSSQTATTPLSVFDSLSVIDSYSIIDRLTTVTETATETVTIRDYEQVWSTLTETSTAVETVTERLIATVFKTRKMTATATFLAPGCNVAELTESPSSSLSSTPTLPSLPSEYRWRSPNRNEIGSKIPSNFLAIESTATAMPYIIKRTYDIEASHPDFHRRYQIHHV